MLLWSPTWGTAGSSWFRRKSRRETTCSVLAAELCAAWRAVQICVSESHTTRGECRSLRIAQRQIRLLRKKNQHGKRRAILREISTSIVQMERPLQRLRIAWVPGHQGIEGNEIADRAAKAATKGHGQFKTPVQKRVRELDGILRLVERHRSDNPTSTHSARKTGQ